MPAGALVDGIRMQGRTEELETMTGMVSGRRDTQNP